MMKDALKVTAAAAGAVISFFSGLPPILWILLAAMTLDYITGIFCGFAGKSLKTEHGGLSSYAAFSGLLKKLLIIAIVALAYLLDHAVTLNVGVQFAAVSGATCLWFIASEGISIVENAAQMGVPIPNSIRRALEIMKGHDDGSDTKITVKEGSEDKDKDSQ